MEQGKRNASSLLGGRGELYAALIHEVAPNGQHRAASVLSTDRTRCQTSRLRKLGFSSVPSENPSVFLSVDLIVKWDGAQLDQPTARRVRMVLSQVVGEVRLPSRHEAFSRCCESRSGPLCLRSTLHGLEHLPLAMISLCLSVDCDHSCSHSEC